MYCQYPKVCAAYTIKYVPVLLPEPAGMYTASTLRYVMSVLPVTAGMYCQYPKVCIGCTRRYVLAVPAGMYWLYPQVCTGCTLRYLMLYLIRRYVKSFIGRQFAAHVVPLMTLPRRKNLNL